MSIVHKQEMTFTVKALTTQPLRSADQFMHGIHDALRKVLEQSEAGLLIVETNLTVSEGKVDIE